MNDYTAREYDGGGGCRWSYLGRLDYREAWELQPALVEARRAGEATDSLLLLEHPPTYTLGRRGTESHLLTPRHRLEERGAVVLEVDRGGEVTYHGPGQLVGYPIIDLQGRGGPRRYVRALETVLIGALQLLGVQAGRIDGLTGVWAGGGKIAAIGVRISRGVTSHGFALNVAGDLSWFQHIIPCGMAGVEVTSVERIVGHSPSLEEMAELVAGRFGVEMGYAMEQVRAEEMLFLSRA